MCTVTWLTARDGFELFANRDESLGRGPEHPPAILARNGVQVVAPRDGDAGGTWIAVNERGLGLCLLNGYGEGRTEQPTLARSRGLVVLGLADAASGSEVERRLAAAELGHYRSFVLLVLEAGGPALVAEWDGARLAMEPLAAQRIPLVSSAVDQSGVRARRSAELARIAERRGGLSAAALEELHTSHADGPSAYSTCMHRSDAATKSFTHVSVSGAQVRLSYQPGPPCLHASRATIALPRPALASR